MTYDSYYNSICNNGQHGEAFSCSFTYLLVITLSANSPIVFTQGVPVRVRKPAPVSMKLSKQIKTCNTTFGINLSLKGAIILYSSNFSTLGSKKKNTWISYLFFSVMLIELAKMNQNGSQYIFLILKLNELAYDYLWNQTWTTLFETCCSPISRVK